MDPRRDPENLREHLLGSRGLIARANRRVEEAAKIPSPRRNTGSYIPAKHGAKSVVLGDGSDTPLMDLCDRLRGWLGLEPVDIRSYLFRFGLTDHYLASSYLESVSETVRSWFQSEHLNDKQIAHLLRLIDILQEWPGMGCVHSFRPGVDPDDGTKYLVCQRCQFRVNDDDLEVFSDERWHFAHDYCEWCGAPIFRASTGRIRRFCEGSKCQVAAWRASENV